MAIITQSAVQTTNSPVTTAKKTYRRFIGKSWINIINKTDSKYNGVKYLTLTKDKNVKISFDIPVYKKDINGKETKEILSYEHVEMDQNDQMQLFPNKKRNGRKDPDFRLSFVSNIQESSDIAKPEPARNFI